MKYAVAVIASNLVSLACVGIAGYLVAHSKDGWGWFLFIGVICVATVKFKGKDIE
jgi:uncharacterized membrane protein HdeD (DUF308 family)